MECLERAQLAATVTNAIVKYDLAYDGTNGTLVMSVDMVDNSDRTPTAMNYSAWPTKAETGEP